MTPRFARWLVRLYPRDWRDRYGEEFEMLLLDGPGGFHALANVLLAAVREHIVTPITPGVIMSQSPNSILLQRPLMGALAMTVPSLPILIYLAVHATEGWQLLVVAALLAGFVVALIRRSRIDFAISYVATFSLFAWVVWVNH
jgi:hypothetical protein